MKLLYIIPPKIQGKWMIREEERSREETFPYVIPPFMGPQIFGLINEVFPQVSLHVIDAQIDDLDNNEIVKRVNSLSPDLVITPMSSFHIRHDRSCAELDYPTIGIITPPSVDQKFAIDFYKLKTRYFTKVEINFTILGAVKEFLNEGKIENTPGMIIHKNGKIVDTGDSVVADLTKLPLPLFGLFNYDRYLDKREEFEGERTSIIETIQGCLFNCTYCSHSRKNKSPRMRSAKQVIGLLRHLKENYNITRFELLDTEFAAKMSRAKEICRELIKENLNLHWFTGNRIDLVDEELLDLMSRAGCDKIAYGIETADPTMQKVIDKVFDVDKAIKTIKLTKKYNISARAFMTPGIQGETYKTLKNSRKFLVKAMPDSFTSGPLMLISNTRFYNECKEKGWILEWDWENYRGYRNKKLQFKHSTFKDYNELMKAVNWFSQTTHCQMAIKRILTFDKPLKGVVEFILYNNILRLLFKPIGKLLLRNKLLNEKISIITN